jgi:hypothetical protein
LGKAMKHLSVLRVSVLVAVLLQIDLESGIILVVAKFYLLVVVIPFIEIDWMMEQYDFIVDQVVYYLLMEDTDVQSHVIKEI